MHSTTQLDCLSALHGRQKIAQWKALARDDDWDGVVEQLLVEHYDPAYLKSIDRNFERAASADVVRIESDAIEDYRAAARALADRSSRPTCPRLTSRRPPRLLWRPTSRQSFVAGLRAES